MKNDLYDAIISLDGLCRVCRSNNRLARVHLPARRLTSINIIRMGIAKIGTTIARKR